MSLRVRLSIVLSAAGVSRQRARNWMNASGRALTILLTKRFTGKGCPMVRNLLATARNLLIWNLISFSGKIFEDVMISRWEIRIQNSVEPDLCHIWCHKVLGNKCVRGLQLLLHTDFPFSSTFLCMFPARKGFPSWFVQLWLKCNSGQSHPSSAIRQSQLDCFRGVVDPQSGLKERIQLSNWEYSECWTLIF